MGIDGHPRRIFLSPEIFVGAQNFSNLGILAIIFSLFIAAFGLQSGQENFNPKSFQLLRIALEI